MSAQPDPRRRAQRPTGARERRPDGRDDGHAAEKSMNFSGSARRLLGLLAPHAGWRSRCSPAAPSSVAFR